MRAADTKKYREEILDGVLQQKDNDHIDNNKKNINNKKNTKRARGDEGSKAPVSNKRLRSS